MEIDYTNMRKMIEIRTEQISDASLEYVYFNSEYLELQKIYQALSTLIIMERTKDQKLEEETGGNEEKDVCDSE